MKITFGETDDQTSGRGFNMVWFQTPPSQVEPVVAPTEAVSPTTTAAATLPVVTNPAAQISGKIKV